MSGHHLKVTRSHGLRRYASLEHGFPWYIASPFDRSWVAAAFFRRSVVCSLLVDMEVPYAGLAETNNKVGGGSFDRTKIPTVQG